MKKYLTIISLGLIISCSSNGDFEGAADVIVNPEVENGSISIHKPEGWIDESDTDIRENLNKYSLESETVSELMNTTNGLIPVAIYTKYDRMEHQGVIPTIQVNLLPNQALSFADFKSDIKRSVTQMKNLYSSFKMIREFENIELDRKKGLHFIASFDLPLTESEMVSVRSWSYVIPVGKYFYQINFSDIESDDCSDLFNEFIENVTFEN